MINCIMRVTTRTIVDVVFKDLPMVTVVPIHTWDEIVVWNLFGYDSSGGPRYLIFF